MRNFIPTFIFLIQVLCGLTDPVLGQDSLEEGDVTFHQVENDRVQVQSKSDADRQVEEDLERIRKTLERLAKVNFADQINENEISEMNKKLLKKSQSYKINFVIN